MAKNFDSRAIALHKKQRGKLAVHSLVRLKTKNDLSLAYTPGVAAVSKTIARNKKEAHTLTMSGRMVAIVSDGSSVLGLGNIGPEAALPVMEGKAILFKEFANVDAVPVVLATQDVEEIVSTIRAIAPNFAGINLEDISAPRCFEIESRLIDELSIPVMHDDQHGTAIVVLAALVNALEVVSKKIRNIKIIFSGAGAAAQATLHLLTKAGIDRGGVIMIDSEGIISRRRRHLRADKWELAKKTNRTARTGGLKEALVGADVFIGMSKAQVLKPEWINTMADQPIIFAMANPDPEISYAEARRTKAAIVGTGRSDIPNQINNVLAFPGVFRGAIDAGAKRITDTMKLAAARAIASVVSEKDKKKGIVVPDPLDLSVARAVAKAVAESA